MGSAFNPDHSILSNQNQNQVLKQKKESSHEALYQYGSEPARGDHCDR